MVRAQLIIGGEVEERRDLRLNLNFLNPKLANESEIELMSTNKYKITDLRNNTNINNKDKDAKNPDNRTLTLSTCNPYIKSFKAMEYAARGPVIMRAMQMEQELRQGMNKPFTKVIKANLGDAHAMGQKPITFLRQVLALISCPSLIDTSSFNSDVKQRAIEILAACRGQSVGAYSDSRGLEIARKHVAQYIDLRDALFNGVLCSPEDIVLCAGASEGIRACLKLFKTIEGVNTKRSGVLVPVPEYPLYSASLGEYDIHKINYFLDESNNWALTIPELERSLQIARRECEPRAIVVINPGNPTGHVLSRKNIEDIIKFAYRENLFILADEVYQDNIYGQTEFVSFRKVLLEMPSPFNKVELVSFYSCSKGYICECGLRGAYFETLNMDSEVKSILLASVAAKLCPTVLGQAAVSCSVNPPQPGDQSHTQFCEERDEILDNLAIRAELVTKGFNSIPGVTCSKIQGAMYAFPKIDLPPEAISAAVEKGQEPDVFYCLELLESTGICVVPGSGIGQLPGTYHFRTTILSSTEELRQMLEKFEAFHLTFVEKYS